MKSDTDENNVYLHFPSGHWYSPLPELRQARDAYEQAVKRSEDCCVGLNLNDQKQLEFLESIRP